MGATNIPPSGSVGQKDLSESQKEESLADEPGSRHGSGSASASGSVSGSESSSSQFDNGDEMPVVATGYYESSRTNMERRVIACVEARLAEPLREDRPILGIEFDELPPGAFGAPIVPTELQHIYRHSYYSNSYGKYDVKQIKASSNGPHETIEPQVRSDAYRHWRLLTTMTHMLMMVVQQKSCQLSMRMGIYPGNMVLGAGVKS